MGFHLSSFFLKKQLYQYFLLYLQIFFITYADVKYKIENTEAWTREEIKIAYNILPWD